jgi:hypothetical protein
MKGSRLCGEVDRRNENKTRNFPAKILSIFSSPENQFWKFSAPSHSLPAHYNMEANKGDEWICRSKKNFDFRLRNKVVICCFVCD